MKLLIIKSKIDTYIIKTIQFAEGGWSKLYKGYRLSELISNPANQEILQPKIGQFYKIPQNLNPGVYAVERLKGINIKKIATQFLILESMQVKAIAIKVLKREYRNLSMVLDGFVNESKIQVFHENVLKIHEFFALEINRKKQYHIVSDYLEGKPLDEVLKERKMISLEETLSIIKQTLKGLSALHGIIEAHRDLKPANLFLCNNGRLVIIDFGIAKTIKAENDPNQTTNTTFKGTVNYAAPEQVTMQNHLIGKHTDIWAVGVIFYELLTGKKPFQGGNEDLVKEAIVTSSSPFIGNTPSSINKIIQKATQKEISKRYQNTYDFLDNIDAYLNPRSKIKPHLGNFDFIKSNWPMVVSIAVSILIILFFFLITR